MHDLLKKFDLTNCNSAKTSLVTATKIEINTKEFKVDISNYRGMVASLLYLLLVYRYNVFHLSMF